MNQEQAEQSPEERKGWNHIPTLQRYLSNGKLGDKILSKPEDYFNLNHAELSKVVLAPPGSKPHKLLSIVWWLNRNGLAKGFSKEVFAAILKNAFQLGSFTFSTESTPGSVTRGSRVAGPEGMFMLTKPVTGAKVRTKRARDKKVRETQPGEPLHIPCTEPLPRGSLWAKIEQFGNAINLIFGDQVLAGFVSFGQGKQAMYIVSKEDATDWQKFEQVVGGVARAIQTPAPAETKSSAATPKNGAPKTEVVPASEAPKPATSRKPPRPFSVSPHERKTYYRRKWGQGKNPNAPLVPVRSTIIKRDKFKAIEP
jgi:hypothetical protein